MDQCSWHDTPPAFSVDLTNRSGRALRLELVVQIVLALTDQRFGDIFTKVAMSCTISLCTSAHGYEPTRLTKSPVRSVISVTSGLRHQQFSRPRIWN